MFRILAALLIAVSVSAVASEPRAVLEGFSSGLVGLDGRFEQRVFDADGQLTEETQGRVALATPRQFRWEYEAPFPQLIVADGDHVWVYDPDLEQVQVRIQSHEEQQSPLAVLIDPTELDRQFNLAGTPTPMACSGSCSHRRNPKTRSSPRPGSASRASRCNGCSCAMPSVSVPK
jgi:outer membrane lipoprotein carrier protein